LKLGFQVVVYDAKADQPVDVKAIYQRLLKP
jgi:hypothetical protein